MSNFNIKYYICPVCGNPLIYMNKTLVCKVCGYTLKLEKRKKTVVKTIA